VSSLVEQRSTAPSALDVVAGRLPVPGAEPEPPEPTDDETAAGPVLDEFAYVDAEPARLVDGAASVTEPRNEHADSSTVARAAMTTERTTGSTTGTRWILMPQR
jgi:hypothetical protein